MAKAGLLGMLLLAFWAGAAAAKTEITNEPGCKIKIKLNLEFYGPGVSDSLINVWKADIVSKWSGLKDKTGWCDIIIEVNTKKRAEGDPATANYDQIKVVQSPDGKHVSWCGNGALGTDRQCEWDDHDSGSVAAHECGHLMGLDNGCEEGYEITEDSDDQTKRKAKKKPGRENSIMSEASCTQKGIQWDIDKILENAGISCPDSCCAGKGEKTTSGGASTPTPPAEKPREPGNTSFIEDPFGHACEITVPASLGGGVVTVNDFSGSCMVEWGPALNPNVDCLADSNWVPIAIRQLHYSAPTFQLPGGQWTGPNVITLRPEPSTPWESTGRLHWGSGQFEMVLATQVVNDLYPPSMPLPCVGVLFGNYQPFSGHAQYQAMLWLVTDTNTGLEDRLRDALHGTRLDLLVAPSPARHRAVVAYALPGSGPTTLDVYDVRGRLVRHLEGGNVPGGLHVARWDLRDAQGSAVPAGVYLFKLRHGSQVVTAKIAVVR
jgi:hypothetical protein